MPVTSSRFRVAPGSSEMLPVVGCSPNGRSDRAQMSAFAGAIEDYLRRETAGIARYVDELNEHSPFRARSSPPPS